MGDFVQDRAREGECVGEHPRPAGVHGGREQAPLAGPQRDQLERQQEQKGGVLVCGGHSVTPAR